MNKRAVLGTCLMGIIMSDFVQPVPAAAPAPTVKRSTVQVEHIRIDSNRSYSEVRAALDRLVPKFDDRIRVLLQYGEIARVKAELENIQGDAGLVIFSIAPQGDWLQVQSGRRNSLQYVIGNVLIATQMIKINLAAGLYAPLRVVLYENKSGTATFEYDRPSSLWNQFGDEQVTEVAQDLDRKIYNVLIAAAQ